MSAHVLLNLLNELRKRHKTAKTSLQPIFVPHFLAMIFIFMISILLIGIGQ